MVKTFNLCWVGGCVDKAREEALDELLKQFYTALFKCYIQYVYM